MLPILENGSLEDDDKLQDLWAQLLANAADATRPEVNRSFVSIVSEFSTLDALLLDTIYCQPAAMTNGGFWTTELPARVSAQQDKPPNGDDDPEPDVQASLENLVRLGCIGASGTWGGKLRVNFANTTELGRRVHEACTGHTLNRSGIIKP
jgi:hypothetical protein